MKEQEENICPVCKSEMKRDSFDGDWLVYECTGSDCNTKIESPTGDPKKDGFTMESLELASNYADDDL